MKTANSLAVTELAVLAELADLAVL